MRKLLLLIIVILLSVLAIKVLHENARERMTGDDCNLITLPVPDNRFNHKSKCFDCERQIAGQCGSGRALLGMNTNASIAKGK